MNVSSSTATTTAAATTASSTSTTAKTQEKSNTSFEDEMKNVEAESQQEQEVQQKKEPENKDTATDKNVDEKADDKKDNHLSGNIDKNEPDGELTLDSKDLLSRNIQQLLDTRSQMVNKTEPFNVSISKTEDLTQNIGDTLNFQSLNMTEADAQFFIDVVNNNNAGVQNVVQDIQQAMTFGSEEVQKSANVSKTLINALHNTQKTGQAVRIDFGNDVAVVMRVGKDGAIMANFIPGDKAVEEYLKNNISILRQRFDEEDIPYSQLSYSQHEQQERQQRRENNKEDKHE